MPTPYRIARAVALSATLLLAGGAHAEIFKHVDENGRVTYSNVPMKGGKKLDLEPVPTISTPKPKAVSAPAAGPTPASFPRVNADTQRKRDDVRRRILEQELAGETRELEKAKKDLADGEATRQGDETRNYQKYLDRVQGLKENVGLHEKNIEALKKELSALK